MGLINSIGEGTTIRAHIVTALFCAVSLCATAQVARADESGTSFWLPVLSPMEQARRGG
jgi:hypothetical protein